MRDLTQITALKAIYQTKVDALTDDLVQAKANVALEAWEAAEIQYQNLLAAEAINYTVVGRTVSKRDIDSARSARDAALADLESLLGVGDPSVTYVNNGGRIY